MQTIKKNLPGIAVCLSIAVALFRQGLFQSWANLIAGSALHNTASDEALPCRGPSCIDDVAHLPAQSLFHSVPKAAGTQILPSYDGGACIFFYYTAAW